MRRMGRILSANHASLYPYRASYSEQMDLPPLNLSVCRKGANPSERKGESSTDSDSVSSQRSLERSENALAENKNIAKRQRVEKLNTGYIFPSRRRITCKICSKVIRADNFQVHQRSHTGEKPYKCPKCPFRSANPSSMPKHLRLHDKAREIYRCQSCSYSTIYKSNLSAHKKTHQVNLESNVKESDSPQLIYSLMERARSAIDSHANEEIQQVETAGCKRGVTENNNVGYHLT